MRRTSLALTLSVFVTGSALASLAGCAPPASSGAPRSRGSLEHDYFIPASSGIGKSEQAVTAGDGPQGQQILFVNFDGASILRVANDSMSENAANNSSWIPDTYSEGQSKAYAAFDVSAYTGYTKATATAFIIGKVQGWYSDFNVQVVSTRPATGLRYTELMVGDKTGNFLQSGNGGDGTVGVATLDCDNSSQVNVGFDFAATLLSTSGSSTGDATDLLLVAQTVAHEAGHTFGLEHVNNVQDIMNPSVDPSVVGFLDSSSTLSDGPASCGSGSTENTHSRLLTNVGPTPTTTSGAKPVVTFLAPKTGDTVPTSFTIAISASEPNGSTGSITAVNIFQGAMQLNTTPITTPPYHLDIMAPGDGSYTLTATATNSEGNSASVSSTFTVMTGATQGPIGCLVGADCMSPQVCTSGTCTTPATPTCDPACATNEICEATNTCIAVGDGGIKPGGDSSTSGGIGTACTDSTQCTNDGVCATSGGKQFCTNVCDPANSSACPSSYACTDVSGTNYCTPKKSSGGCAYVGAPGSSSPASLALFLGFLGFLISRRRSRPSAT